MTRSLRKSYIFVALLGLVLNFTIGAATTPAYAQFDKIKKAVDKDKKEDKDKKDKKTEKKAEQEDKSGAATSSGSSKTAGGSQEVKRKTIDDCDDTKEAKSYLYWVERNLTSYNNPWKAKEYAEKTRASLAKAKSSCPDVDVSAMIKELTEYEKQIAAMTEESDSKEKAEKLLSQATFLFADIIGSGWVGKYKKKEEAQKLYDECVKTDYLNYKKQLDDILSKDADLNAKANEEYGAYTSMMKNYQQFEEYVNTFLLNEINQAIEEAYAQKSKGKNNLNNALDAAEAAVLTVQAILYVIPNHAKAQKLLKDTQAVVAAVEKDMGGAIYTSALHKQNAGKIIFSKSPITIKAENPSVFASDFTGNDYIYGMAYLKGPIESLAYNWECAVKIYVDDNEKITRRFSASEQAKKQTWLELEIVPDAATAVQSGGIEYSKALSEISPRPHVIKVEFWDNEFTNLLAVGEFSLDASEGMDKLQSNAKKLAQKALDKVRMPAAGMQNASFEQVIKNDWTNDRYKALRAVVYDKDWSIKRNAITNAIEHRFVWCAVAVKTNEGDCKIFYVSYKQDYAGGNYGAFKKWGMGDNQLINCDNVYK